MILPVVLCGGSGSRLWPVSREALPKQFVPLLGPSGNRHSLLNHTLERAEAFAKKVICVASEQHRFLVQREMSESGLEGVVLIEPEGRNTAAAMTCAAMNADPETLLLFLPSDQHIPDIGGLVGAVTAAGGLAEAGWIVTFGVQPTCPSSSFGYIQRGDPIAGEIEAWAVKRFVEKPDQTHAAELLAEGNHLWNSGIFLMRSDILIESMKNLAPDILAACTAAVAGQEADGMFLRLQRQSFLECRSQSIDYAVMEHHERVAVVPLGCPWSDVGNWAAVAAMSAEDADGNRINGQGRAIRSQGTFIDAPHRPVVALGASDLIIVDTHDAVLVAHVSRAEEVKEVVAQLKGEGVQEATVHRRVVRPWGWHDTTDRGERFLVRRLVVNPGARLSLQKHSHRAEHWVVVKGLARVTNAGNVFDLRENESTYIPVGVQHRLENPGVDPLEIIEVQTGSILSEDDIVRFDDDYGRSGT